MELEKINATYKDLISQISGVFREGQRNSVATINRHIVETYRHIGRYIVEFEQSGEERAKYGKALIDNFAKGFSQQ